MSVRRAAARHHHERESKPLRRPRARAGNNIRSSWSPDCNVLYSAGANEGVRVASRGSSTTTVVSSSPVTNVRSLGADPAGGMYLSTGSGTPGLYSFSPTVTNVASNLLTATSASPYAFAWESLNVVW